MAYTTIDKPTDYFNTVLWTGNGADRTITTDHATDWIWMKDRDQAIYHRLTDSVRGSAKVLFTNVTDAEQSDQYGTVGSFTSTGFTIRQGASNSNYVGANENNIKYVGWSWVAGGSASSNSDGSITSTVSANTTSGFSIVSYTGTGSNATVGHGLGVAPKLLILKSRTRSDGQWTVGSDMLGWSKFLFLDATSAEQTFNLYQNTAPTSSVFYLSGDGGVNQSSGNMIGYAFAEKKGYSKFGSYTGNGNADGAFVYTGFKPAFLLVKKTSGSESWCLLDNKRDPFNLAGTRLIPNSTAADSNVGGGNSLDILSNGFKARDGAGQYNDSGQPYIYMALAEAPFVSSGGIPTTAR